MPQCSDLLPDDVVLSLVASTGAAASLIQNSAGLCQICRLLCGRLKVR